MFAKKISLSICIFFGVSTLVNAQISGYSNPVITTAVPFLTISPDARSGGLGDAGVAISPDANSVYWNVGKLAFVQKDYGAAISYSPWLRKLVNDMSLAQISGYAKIRKNEAIGISFRYFKLGEIQFTDQVGNKLQTYRPNEFSVGAVYSRKMSKNWSVGLGLKYLRSDLAGNVTIPGSNTVAKPASTAAADIGVYHNNNKLIVAGRPAQFSFGANISDLGGKVTYTDNDQREFIPTNLRLGVAGTIEVDQFSKVVLIFDVNKLMVPSTPTYKRDAGGNLVIDPVTNKPIIDKGKDPHTTGVLSGVLGSFTDAPGGFNEELQEIILNPAIEYWYNDLFAVRAGYHYENKNKGNRKYVTLGLGVHYNVFGLDFAYLIPVAQNNPLAETLRFTLHFDFEKVKDSAPVIEE
jgi:hypothetical protein